MNRISETDLILNADGSAYHLNLHPGDIAETVITVGDPDRVGGISKYFDTIELKKGKREFITHTGAIGNKRITVLSTGIGTDNIDIVFNELDALVNIDFNTRTVNPVLRSLKLVRIGTSGAVQADIPVDSLLLSSAAFGLDPLMLYYQQALTANEQALLTAFKNVLPAGAPLSPYVASAGQSLLAALGKGEEQGITITAPGFYAPQGRQVRATAAIPQLMDIIQQFNFNGQRITNLEMETAGIYGLAAALGHQAVSCNVILANRITQKFSTQPAKIMDHYIKHLLDKLTRA
ncbi:nucleoside phosphorylase [Mucilaginibacter sp. UR6-11]|uniref:nucleoside phosphorylase n=1 Tax=Mucilaginibacter sp. UR6-11 TaxID=1435644 RepID=UPI001E2A146E|nr:nucleoside phosphorylase [Mucilaginibacter sp. UR6-11]MCC8425677.1 nucleoside phosphorylase [Mucilaginibacter sp. UR6-11]